MQYFEWYLPNDGTLWKDLKNDAQSLSEDGINSVWMPPAYKGEKGNEDVGYGVYDLYDLGEFDQKDTVATKYGTKQEYLDAVHTCQDHGIEVIADVVLNHRMGADEKEKVHASRMDWDDRNKVICDLGEIDVWTRFTFPGRGDEYSDFVWDWTCFDGTDYDATNKETVLLTFEGKTWDENVSKECGNFDFIMGNDLDFSSPKVVDELYRWGEWYYQETKVDGYRLDAIKSIDSGFFPDWLKNQRRLSGQDSFAVGEYWVGDTGELCRYLDDVDYCMTLFDAPLHFHLYDASHSNGTYDMRTIFDNTLLSEESDYSMVFVDNHDTQIGQALESWVDGWFKQHAYALTLLHGAENACVFYGDYYGIAHDDISMVPGLPEMVKLRSQMKDYRITDYFDDPHCIGWVVQQEKPFVVVMTNGQKSCKKMTVRHKPLTTFVDILHGGEIKTDKKGRAKFPCGDGSCSIYVEKTTK